MRLLLHRQRLKLRIVQIGGRRDPLLGVVSLDQHGDLEVGLETEQQPTKLMELLWVIHASLVAHESRHDDAGVGDELGQVRLPVRLALEHRLAH